MNTLEIEPYSMMLQSSLQLLSSATTEIPTEWPSVTYTVFFVLGCVFFLLLNAFFVASEFAIVKVRPSQIDTAKKDFPERAAKARKIVDNLDGYLSANQLGITIASLALGLLAEPYIAGVLNYLLLNRFYEWTDGTVDLREYQRFIGGLSYFTALALFTVLHVVIGELIPKAIAIRKPLETTLALSRWLDYFFLAFYLPIKWLNGLANIVLKRVFKIDPLSEAEHAHSSEELALLVEESEKKHEVTETEREILINALELNDVYVKDVMTTRSDVVALDVDDSFRKNLDIANHTKHTRFPLIKGHLDNAIGLIHIKDLLRFSHDDQPDLMTVKRELKVVPETMPLDVLLKFFLKEHAHLAMVVDEFGDPAGLVFLDNVIEELVGDIQDEFDQEVSSFTRVNKSEFVVEGSLTLNELSDHEPRIALNSNEVTTVGGYITQQMGRIPEPGEICEVEGFEARVTSTDGRRVSQVHFRKLPEPEPVEAI
ncbi:hemolysin family protein [Rubritalea profundi]|uniref:Uncharacterized protein n=1 Tax=Rubritalea profundi TaxID=1658618 RepID=A0A2S7U293_9BACT|nr:hemolysin family protein [Rubritalea profundi]PQJ29118.1 hypothetical protein BSZ32_11865 [Rubritalea profundi]